MLNPFSKNKKRKFHHQPPRPAFVVTKTRRRIRLARDGRPVELVESSVRLEVNLPSFIAGARAWLVEQVSLARIGFTFATAAAGGLV